MKKLFIIFSAGFICLLTSCNGKKEDGGMSDKAKKNLDAHHAISKMFETRDFSKLGDYIATDAVDHAGTGDVKGLDNIKAELEGMSKMMTDDKMEILKEMADDEYVMSWGKESGKMNVDEMGMKAGDHYTWNIIEVAKFKDGKATEHWSFMSMADMMKMMPPMDHKMDNKMMDNAKDSTKM